MMVEEDKQIKNKLLAELRERGENIKERGEGKVWQDRESADEAF